MALGAWPDLGTQPRDEAPGGLLVKIVENALINIGLLRLSPREWPKGGCWTVKKQLKKPESASQKLVTKIHKHKNGISPPAMENLLNIRPLYSL